MEVSGNEMCFGCGAKNPIGMKLRFTSEGELFFTEYTPRPEMQGYAGVIHGGIVSTLLDEVMANHVLSRGILVVTAELTIRFIKTVRLGSELKIVSKIVKQSNRLSEVEGWIEDSSGQILATGKAKMVHVTGKE